MKSVIDNLFGAAEQSNCSVSQYTKILRNQSVDDFNSILAPAMARSIRRSASRCLETVVQILEISRVDMSGPISLDLVAAMLECWKLVDVLPFVARGVSLVFAKSVSSEAQIAIWKQVEETFPKLGQQNVDTAASLIVIELVSSPKSKCTSLLFIESGLVSQMLKQLKSGASDDTKKHIASAIGAILAYTVSMSVTALHVVRDELVPTLMDKKTSEPVKESLLLAIERVVSSSDRPSAEFVPIDSILPYLSFLVSGRLTMRQMCLAAWSVLFHIKSADKRLSSIYASAVESDVTFTVVLGAEETTAEIRRLLRAVLTLSVSIPGFPYMGKTEVETVCFPSVNSLKNRFPIALVRGMATMGITLPSVSPELANRLVLALYETVALESLPISFLRRACLRISNFYDQMQPEWQALFVILAHHSGFYQICQIESIPVSELVGFCFAGAAKIALPDVSGFRKACLASLTTLVASVDDDQIVAMANQAMDSLKPVAISSSDLEIYFASPQIVVRPESDFPWIPTDENFVLPSTEKKSTKSLTREDMMRNTLKEQAVVRARIAAVASVNQFALAALVILAQASPSVCSLVVSEVRTVLSALGSPLTQSVAFELLQKITRSEIAAALLAVASNTELAEEVWLALFDGIDTVLPPNEMALMTPLFAAVASEKWFKPEIALASLDAYTRLCAAGQEFVMEDILINLGSIAKISAKPFSGPIGKILRALAPKLALNDATRFCAVGTTDEPKLFTEFASALGLVDLADSQTIDAFRLMASFHDSQYTKRIASIPILEALVLLLADVPLMQTLASQSLAWIAAADDKKLLTKTIDSLVTDNVGSGIALALTHVGKLAADLPTLAKIIDFIVGVALPANSSDQYFTALSETLSTQFGEEHAMDLIALVSSKYVGKTNSVAASLAVPVILGILCKFLSPTDEKVGTVRTQLVAELLSAAPEVQVKIAAVLPPLLKMNDDKAVYLETFMNTALTTTDPRARYGAALGVGAAVKAQGVALLRQLEVLKRLQTAAQNKQSTDQRQGAIAVYGGLSLGLSRLFEPYVAQVLPILLVAFGDNQILVRDAANLASSQIMANLSTHGIKLVLPSLLAGIEDLQWRTKLGSIQLLSAMIHCAPKQLATCLPKIVPALSEVATDTHTKVKEAAGAALREVGGVIANPEIQACAHKLIASLTDPANDALRQDALDTLLSTSFVHSLDAASLALVIPVMLRATRERRSEIKRKGAQILGSIAVLSADPQEGLGPYMHKILPALQDVLIDPIPDVRATAAKAMGTMARALPEPVIQMVLPWLFQTLKQAESQVERAGAAHGLSEVLVELGTDHFAEILPEVVANATNPNTTPEAREGYLGLFVFLPGVMKNSFIPYIDVVFPVLVGGLSDPLQSVREVAQRSAIALCTQFAATHATMLMPSLEVGLFASDWRARQASGQLTGLVLEQLMKNSRGNKDNLLECQVPLTQERRSYMLAMLYIIRSDPNQYVNQCAQQVWKNVVSNTPRTLRLILPILVRLIINNLSSNEEETRQLLAGRCLGDLVSKLGDRVLPDLMPILIENVGSTDPLIRAGFCIGLTEIVQAAHRQLLQEYFSIMFPAIRATLCDEEVSVRVRSSALVKILHTNLGNTTINSTLPFLLDQLARSDNAEMTDATTGIPLAATLRGMEQLVLAMPREMVPLITDTLTVAGATVTKLKGLETLHVVASQAELGKQIGKITPFLTAAYPELPEATMHAAHVLFGHLNKPSCQQVMTELVQGLINAEGPIREASAALLGACMKTSPLEIVMEYTEAVIPLFVKGILTDSYLPAMTSALEGFNELTTKITKEVVIKYMESICDTVTACSATEGLGLPKVFETLWLIYQQALMFGTPASREAAASGLVVLVERTPVDRLKPNAIKVTGPLIRVLGDRYPSVVRLALLKTLQILLVRLESALKPFLPQLQTTYQKCAQDSDEAVRELAEESQAILTKLTK